MDLDAGGKSSSRRNSRQSTHEDDKPPSRKSSRLSERLPPVEEGEQIERASKRRNSQAKAEEEFVGNRRSSRMSNRTTEEPTSARETPEFGKRPERIRREKRDYSPESDNKSMTIQIPKVRGPRKSGSASIQASPSPAPELLGKREAKPKPRFSPTPQEFKKNKERRPSEKQKLEIEFSEEDILKFMSEGAEALTSSEEKDYILPTGCVNLQKTMFKADEVNEPSKRFQKTVKEIKQEDREERQTATPERTIMTPSKLILKAELEADEEMDATQAFGPVQVKEELIDEEDYQGPSTIAPDPEEKLVSEENCVMDTVATTRRKRTKPHDAERISEPKPALETETRSSLKRRKTKLEAESKAVEKAEEPQEPPPKKARKGKESIQVKSESEENETPAEESRRSRRSTASFKNFMAQVRGGGAQPVTPKSQSASIKLKKKGKSEMDMKKEEKMEEDKSEENLTGIKDVEDEQEPLITESEPSAEPEEKQEEHERPSRSGVPKRTSERKLTRRSDRTSKKAPSSSTSPALIRRSGRSSIPSTKLLEAVSTTPASKKKPEEKKVEKEPEKETVVTEGKKEAPKFNVKAKPGSALEILKKTSQYKRIERSPSPPSHTPSGASSSKSTPEKPKEKIEKVEIKEAKESEELKKEEEVKIELAEEVKAEDVVKKVPEKSQKPSRKTHQKTPQKSPVKIEISKEELVPDLQEKEEMYEELVEDEELDSPIAYGKKMDFKGTIKITPRVKKTAQIIRSPEKKTPEKALPESLQPTRRSGRVLKPKISEDYIFDAPVVIRKDVEIPKTPVKSLVKSPSPSKKEVRQHIVPVPKEPESVEESAAEKTRKYMEEHKGPIKLSFKIGSEVATVVKNPNNEEASVSATPGVEPMDVEKQNEPEVVVKPPPPPPPKSHAKKPREPAWWTNYTPSPKPVLENFVRPDGTIEHLGVVINSVMDHLLLKVCDDGIRRHSNNKGKEARKLEMSEMAKKRYHDKKRQAEERLARGEPLLLPKKTSAELNAHTISTRERTKKGALYRSNEFLLKPMKLAKEAELEREKQEQEARDYLNRQFMREAEEDLRNERRQKRTEKKDTKSIKHVTFKEFIETKGEKTAALFSHHPNPDFFHREILRDPDDLPDNLENIDGDIDDVDKVLPDPTNDASINFIGQAKIASEQICALLIRRMNQYGGCDIYDLLERVREEPDLRQAVISNTIEILTDFQQIQLGVEYSPNAQITMHNEAIRRAYDLRDAFNINNADRETITWAHSFMVQNLPADYLSGYLILLRYWKHQAGSSVASFAKKPFQEEVYPWPQITDIVWSYITNKIIDPDRENLQATINVEALSDVIFVLVPPDIQFGEYAYTTRAHEVIFRWLKTIGSKESFILKLEYDSENNETIWEAVDIFVKIIKNEIQKLVRETRDKRIVLVGWRLSCYLNHRVVQLIHGVSAIIDLAFNQKTDHGYRGTCDDDILLTYCPSLFIIGSSDPSFNHVALKDMRTLFQSETGAIIVHHADENLFVPSFILNRYNITMRTIYRAIVEHIVTFLNLPCTKKERSQLIQLDLNSVYNLDVDSLKAIAAPGQGAPQRIAQHRVTTDGAPKPSAPRQRKRKTDYTHPPHLVMGNQHSMPALFAEASSMDQVRYRFDEVVRNARTGIQPEMSPITTPRTAPAMFKTLNSPMASPRTTNPMNFRPNFTNPPPLSTQTGPIDPANISLN